MKFHFASRGEVTAFAKWRALLTDAGVKRSSHSPRANKASASATPAKNRSARRVSGARRAHAELSPAIRAGASGIHGHGVYAETAIADGTRIIEYVGERITKAESKRREARRVTDQRKGREACVTIFNLNRRYDLDGRAAHNVARLINHSCAPNCRAEQIRGRIWIVARRDIAIGEELTFDYGYPLKDWSLHPCRCGARLCPGFIVDSRQRRRLRRILRQERRAVPTARAA